MIAIRKIFFVLLVPALLLASCSLGLAGFAVNGNLNDWGITVADNDGSSWPSDNPGIGDGFQYLFYLEDQSDTAGDGGYLNPNHGGQNYDAEFLGVAQMGDYYLIAIVTGQRYDNGTARFSPGDIRISTGSSLYGIEVGGAADGIVTETSNNAGATFNVTSNGYTDTSDPYADTLAAQTAGTLWETHPDDNWILDPIVPQDPVQMQMTMSDTGKLKGTADYIYTNGAGAYDGDQHAIIELMVEKSLFDADILSVRWAPSCGNDYVEVIIPDGTLPVPEPGSLALLGLGAFSLLGLRRRRKTEVPA